MAVNDLVLTPEGLLAFVEAIDEAGATRVIYVNHETRGIYPKGAALPVVARRADLDKARTAFKAPAPKEG